MTKCVCAFWITAKEAAHIFVLATQVMDFGGIAAVFSVIFLSVTTPTYLGTVFVQDLISEREVYTREFHGARRHKTNEGQPLRLNKAHFSLLRC